MPHNVNNYYLVLDESTSSLSEEDEHYFYTQLQDIGMTLLSIGHRSTIKQVIYCTSCCMGNVHLLYHTAFTVCVCSPVAHNNNLIIHVHCY